MPRRRRRRADGSPAPRGRRTPKPRPSAAELEALDRLTDALPGPLRAFRDRGILSPLRRFRLEEAIRHRTRSLLPVLYGVHDPHNQAAVLRTCEALGVQEVHLTAAANAPFRPSSRITQNAHRWLDVLVHSDFPVLAASLSDRGFELWAADVSPAAVPLADLDCTRRLGLIFGNESAGLSAEVLDICAGSFVIPLHGFSQSLNISVAAAISLWWCVEQRRLSWGDAGDLSEGEKHQLRSRFYRQAAGERVPPDLARALADL